MKKKILYIVECMEKGVGRHVIDLYSNLSKNNDFEIYVIFGKERSSKIYIDQIEIDKRYELSTLKRKIGFNDIKSFFEIKKIIKLIKPDIVHCHSAKAGLSGRIAAKFSKVNKIIYSPHAYMFLNYKEKTLKWRIFLLAEKILSRLFTNYTITTSQGEDDVFIKYKIDKSNKKRFIEHGIQKPIFEENQKTELRQSLNIKKDDILIGSMARFETQKDPVGIFEIMKKISMKNQNVKCIFWGNGSLYEKVKELNEKSDNIVQLEGETKEPDLCLSILDIYLTASLYEGLPYTLVESLGLGLPVVASNVVGNRDCVFENENGKLFEAQNYDEAVNKIQDMVTQNNLGKYGNRSLEIFNERFSMENMIKNYILVYKGSKDE